MTRPPIGSTRQPAPSRPAPLSPGGLVRISGGATWRGRPIGPRGRFRIVRVYSDRRGRRFVDAVRLDAAGLAAGLFTLFVAGPPYRRASLPGIIFRPCRVKPLKPSPTVRKVSPR
jgi:hypothetical protein